MPDELNKLPD